MTYRISLIPTHFYYAVAAVVFVGLCLWRLIKSFKAEKFINQYGYVVLSRQNELEHRYIAKQLLGRELKHNEVVHHINGRKTENEVTNLCLMDREKHEHFHSWLSWKKDKTGKYPLITSQKRTLVREYGGTLLEGLVAYRSSKQKPEISVALDRKKTERNNLKNQNSEFSEKLFGELRMVRMRLAIKRGVPAYVICNNKTLRKIVDTMPETKEKISQIDGFDPESSRMHGAYLVAVISRMRSEFEKSKREDSA